MSNQTARTLKENDLVAYSIHEFLLKIFLSKRRFLIDNGYKLVAFLPVVRKESVVFEEAMIFEEEEL